MKPNFLRSPEMVALVCLTVTAPLVVMAMSHQFRSGRDLLLGAALLFDLAGLALGVQRVLSPRVRD